MSSGTDQNLQDRTDGETDEAVIPGKRLRADNDRQKDRQKDRRDRGGAHKDKAGAAEATEPTWRGGRGGLPP